MSEPGLECRNVSYVGTGFPGEPRQVLRRATASFGKGRVALVTGEMGAGKTTLLSVLAGLLRPTEGEVIAEGFPVSRWTMTHRDRWRRKVGLVFQASHLWADLTVLENVMLPMIPRSKSLNRQRSAGLESLEMLGVAHLAGRSVRELSAGERQRVSVSRAMVSRPAVVLADEPTAHQDEEGVMRILGCLVLAAGWNAAVVVASHDPRVEEAGRSQDRWHMTQGRIERKA